MATINKDFKVKNGLIVEGTTGTINNHDILTKKTDDQNYIVNLIGGTATSANEANKVVKRDANGNFAAGTITANLTGAVTGNASTATTLETSRKIELTGNVTGEVMFNGSQNVQISTTLNGSFATDAEVATAKSEAIAAAAADATTKADAAQAAAISAAAADATSKANAAQAAAIAHADALVTSDVAESGSLYFTDERAQDAIGNNLGSGLSYNDTTGAISVDTSVIANKSYVDSSVAGLVDGAPDLLNTLNELAAAISDDANFATTLTTSVGTKVSKAGDTMTGLLVLSADPSANLGAATKQYVDAAEADAISTASADASAKADAAEADAITAAAADATTKANAAQSAAISAAAADATSKANAAQAAAIAHADALDTDDVAEGTANEYFTDARAKSSAAALLTGASLTNITITGSGSGLVITAENGVADSTTADLDEDPAGTGTSGTWYFTNARAVTALEAVVPNFTAVELNSVAKQVAATASIATASTNTAVSWLKAEYRSAEFLVKIANGSHTDVSKVILTLDTSDNVAITEYAMVGTNGSLGSVSADVSGNDVRLRVTTANNTSTVAVIGTLLA